MYDNHVKNEILVYISARVSGFKVCSTPKKELLHVTEHLMAVAGMHVQQH
jgi:hypothetical protein